MPYLRQRAGVFRIGECGVGTDDFILLADMLGHFMAEDAETERILKIPAVRVRYNNCGLSICRC
jgi:hypothetical protein